MPPVSQPLTDTRDAATARDGRRWLRHAMALFLVVVTAFYAFIAFDTGRSQLHYLRDADSATQVAQIRAAADAGIDVRGSAAEQRYAPLWQQWMADLTDARFSYDSDSLFNTQLHYAQMPATNQMVLALHMLLGGTCMLLGGLQFWPGLRRQFPRLHRGAGMVFLGAAQLAMLASMVYLTLTGVANTYAQLTFHVGLWFLAITVSVALWLAMFHIWRQQIAQHMGWLALAYGLLISAPLTRYDWIAVGMLFPQVSFNEANYAMMAMLLVQCFLVGYGLIAFSRWRAPARRVPQPLPWADRVRAALPLWLPALSLLLLALAATTVWFNLVAPGLAESPLAARVIPAGVIANETRVLAPQLLPRLLYTLLTVGVLLLAPFFLRRAFTLPPAAPALPADLRRTGMALAVATALGALIQCAWGYALGAPSHATLAGGTFYTLAGSTGLLFALLLARAVRQQQLALVKELGLFTLVAASMAPLFYWMLFLLDAIGIPAPYLASGHGYGLAIGLAPTGLLGAFVYAIYGSASRARAVH